MKQTAVEWLVEKLSYETSDGTIISHHKTITHLVEKAKEMEKKEIKRAYTDGQRSAEFKYPLKAEQYYNEQFKSE